MKCECVCQAANAPLTGGTVRPTDREGLEVVQPRDPARRTKMYKCRPVPPLLIYICCPPNTYERLSKNENCICKVVYSDRPVSESATKSLVLFPPPSARRPRDVLATRPAAPSPARLASIPQSRCYVEPWDLLRLLRTRPLFSFRHCLVPARVLNDDHVRPRTKLSSRWSVRLS